ncbi:MAG: S1C family serine protease [Thermoleophilia bacterium]|nr:S1C family serine protease [Thermoleophilia bacterium]MDH3725281.1 S1C family serine protease [Thermoleophilia bacterium]
MAVETLTGIGSAVAGAAERLGPSVVGLGRGRGSGVVIVQDHVLTLAPMVSRGQPTVVFSDGRRETAEIAGVDRELGIAVLTVSTADATPIARRDDELPGLGSPVIALADPGGRGLRATAGWTTSAARTARGPRGRRLESAIEHTAPLPRGSAGGPLVDLSDRLVGVNALRTGEGLVLAVGATAEFWERVEAAMRGEVRERPRLGVAVMPPRAARRMRRAVGLDERGGVLVSEVEPDSPADAAGLRRGDLIVAIDEQGVDGLDALYERLGEAAPGQAITIGYVRGVEDASAEVTLKGRSS